MAATKEVIGLTEQIFKQAGLALDHSYNERVRQLGDASCRAGIEATITYLSEKTELSESELEMLSAGNIPEHIAHREFEGIFARLNATANPKLSGNDKGMCRDAFESGLSAAIYHLLKAAKTQQTDLLSLVPSED